MKIDGVDPVYLKSLIHLYTYPSSQGSWPSASITVPSGILLLGGGAKVTYGPGGYGNMIIYSYPSTYDTWTVGSKDQLVVCQATITVYAIGIEDVNFYNVGRIRTYIESATSKVNNCEWSVQKSASAGWAMTCPGGNWDGLGQGWGRLMNAIYPNGNKAIAYNRDCIRVDRSGNLTAYVLSVKIY